MIGTHIRYHWKAKILIFPFPLVIEKELLWGGICGPSKNTQIFKEVFWLKEKAQRQNAYYQRIPCSILR